MPTILMCIAVLNIEGVRNIEVSRKAVESFVDASLTNGKVFYENCDTGDNESVRQFAQRVQQKFDAIHLLINNGKLCFNSANFY